MQPTKHRASLPKRKRQATGNIVRTLKTREEEGIITHRCSNVSATQSIPSAIDANKCSAAEKTPCSVAKTLYRPFSLDSGINSEERPTLVKKRVGNSVGAIGAELSVCPFQLISLICYIFIILCNLFVYLINRSGLV